MRTYIHEARQLLIEEFQEKGLEIPPKAINFYLVLMLTLADSTMPEDVHDTAAVFSADRRLNEEKIIPFDQLSAEERDSYLPYAEAIVRVAKRYYDYE